MQLNPVDCKSTEGGRCCLIITIKGNKNIVIQKRPIQPVLVKKRKKGCNPEPQFLNPSSQ